MVHIGSKIKEVHKASGLSVTAFAKKIHTSRRNVYIIFGKATIDTGQLVRIGAVLKHDFFRYYTTDLPGEIPATSEDSAGLSISPGEEDRLARLESELAALKQAFGALLANPARQ